MSNFAEVVKQDTPRLVVECEVVPGKGERFKWGMVGALPLLTLIGYIARVQHDIIGQLAERRNECSEVAFVIAWTGTTFDWWLHRDIPVDSLVGMLETIKLALISQAATPAARGKQGPSLLGPDGRPFPMR